MKLVISKQVVKSLRHRVEGQVADVSQEDEERFFRVISTDLDEEQRRRIIAPIRTYPREESVLAVHWHPEFVPQELIDQRLDLLYPNRKEELIIPTQHNQLLTRGSFCGAEVDCYSKGFKRKVQLLVHFDKKNLNRAGTFASALEHTFQYRSSQLFDLINTLTKPVEERLERAARETGAAAGVIDLVRGETGKVARLIDLHFSKIPKESIKNKLLRDYLDTLRGHLGDDLVIRAQLFLRAVKQEVKAGFPLTYFYRTSEIIEEARAIGAGIVIPHPEQFWPILLAEYDVDGYEVWNPQSLEYTDFLISVVINKNKQPGIAKRKLLIFMGDDTHMGEKARGPLLQDELKSCREIGLQPPWDDLLIRKKLAIADMDRHKVIAEYRDRLRG
jgi:hypothetical protein